MSNIFVQNKKLILCLSEIWLLWNNKWLFSDDQDCIVTIDMKTVIGQKYFVTKKKVVSSEWGHFFLKEKKKHDYEAELQCNTKTFNPVSAQYWQPGLFLSQLPGMYIVGEIWGRHTLVSLVVSTLTATWMSLHEEQTPPPCSSPLYVFRMSGHLQCAGLGSESCLY